MSIKVIIFTPFAHHKTYLDEVLPKLNQDKIYQQISMTKDPKVLSLYLLAISLNEDASGSDKSELYYFDNLDGSNLPKLDSIVYELYDRDVSVLSTGVNPSTIRDYEPWVAMAIVDGVYAGHLYFWSIHSDVYNIMGIRASMKYRNEGSGNMSLILLSAVRRWVIKRNQDAYLRLIAPYPHMKRIAKQLGFVRTTKCFGFIQGRSIGCGPVTNPNEDYSDEGYNLACQVSLELFGEESINYQLVNLT